MPFTETEYMLIHYQFITISMPYITQKMQLLNEYCNTKDTIIAGGQILKPNC